MAGICSAENTTVEPVATVSLTLETPQAGQCELRVNDDRLITALAAALPETVTMGSSKPIGDSAIQACQDHRKARQTTGEKRLSPSIHTEVSP